MHLLMMPLQQFYVTFGSFFHKAGVCIVGCICTYAVFFCNLGLKYIHLAVVNTFFFTLCDIVFMTSYAM